MPPFTISRALRNWKCSACNREFDRPARGLAHICKGTQLQQSGSDLQHDDSASDSSDCSSSNGVSNACEYDAFGGADYSGHCSDSSSNSSSNSTSVSQMDPRAHDSDLQSCASDNESSDPDVPAEGDSSSSDSDAERFAPMQKRQPAHSSQQSNSSATQQQPALPRLGQFHLRKEGTKVYEGDDVRFHTKAANSAYYPFMNYTEAALFMVIHRHQLSGSAVRDMLAAFEGTYDVGAARSDEAAAADDLRHDNSSQQHTSVHQFCTHCMPKSSTAFMAKYRKYLPLAHIIQHSVKNTAGKPDRVLHFPIGMLLQRQLLSKRGSRLVTQCTQSHTLTAEEGSRNGVDAWHLTAVPTQPADDRTRSAQHGQMSRRCVFQTVNHVRAANGDRVHIGDIASIQQSDGQPSSTCWAIVRAIWWSDALQQLRITVSNLLTPADVAAAAGSAKLRTAPSTAAGQHRAAVQMYEVENDSSEYSVDSRSILCNARQSSSQSQTPIQIVGHVRYVQRRTCDDAASAAANSTARSSKRRSSDTTVLEHVQQKQVRPYFDMHAKDVRHPTDGQSTAAVSIGLFTDKFSVTQMQYSSTSFSATYMQMLALDSHEARRRCNMLVCGFGCEQIPWQLDTRIHTEELHELERGVLADLRIGDEIVKVRTPQLL